MPTIGKIKVNLEGDTRRFERSMRGARRTVTSFSQRMASLRRSVALVGGALGFGLLVRRTTDEAIVMKQLADRVGTNVDRFSRLARVLGRSGIELSQVGTIVQRLVRRAGEAAEGNEKLAATFESLGIDLTKFIELDPVEQFVQLGEALAGVENDNMRLLKAFRILDTEGVKVLQADLAALREEIKQTSGISNEQAAQVTRLAEQWDKVKEAARSAFLTIGASTGLFDALARGLAKVEALFQPETLRGTGAAQRVRRDPRAALRKLLAPGLDLPGFFPQEPGPPAVTAPLTGTIGGGRSFIGGDLTRSNQLLEQIRNNTAKLGAVAQ